MKDWLQNNLTLRLKNNLKSSDKYQNNGQRKLKVYKKYVYTSLGIPVFFPEIRLLGKWLKDSGFKNGQSVIVSTEQNKITITIETESQVG